MCMYVRVPRVRVHACRGKRRCAAALAKLERGAVRKDACTIVNWPCELPQLRTHFSLCTYAALPIHMHVPGRVPPGPRYKPARRHFRHREAQRDFKRNHDRTSKSIVRNVLRGDVLCMCSCFPKPTYSPCRPELHHNHVRSGVTVSSCGTVARAARCTSI